MSTSVNEQYLCLAVMEGTTLCKLPRGHSGAHREVGFIGPSEMMAERQRAWQRAEVLSDWFEEHELETEIVEPTSVIDTTHSDWASYLTSVLLEVSRDGIRIGHLIVTPAGGVELVQRGQWSVLAALLEAAGLYDWIARNPAGWSLPGPAETFDIIQARDRDVTEEDFRGRSMRCYVGISGLTRNDRSVTLPSRPTGSIIVVKDEDGSLRDHTFTVRCGEGDTLNNHLTSIVLTDRMPGPMGSMQFVRHLRSWSDM